MIVLEQLKEQVKAANATTAGASGERMESDKDEDEEEGRLRKRVIRKSSLWIRCHCQQRLPAGAPLRTLK